MKRVEDEELEKYLRKHLKKEDEDLNIENWLTPEELKIVRKMDKVLISDGKMEDL